MITLVNPRRFAMSVVPLALVVATSAAAQQGASQASGSGAGAQGTGPADAAYSEAIARAVKHFEASRFDEALAAFMEAHVLQPSARTFRGVGLANYSRGDFVAARRAFEHALIDSRRPLTGEPRREVEALLAETAQRTGRFELRITPGDAKVEVDGVPTTDRELLLGVGSHALVVSASGHALERSTLQVSGGEVQTLRIALAPRDQTPPIAAPTGHDAPVAKPAPAPPREPPPDAPPRRANVWPWVVMAASPVFAATAAAVWFTGKGKRDDIEDQCARDECSDSEVDRQIEAANLSTYETATGILIGASILSAAGGLTWLLVAPDRQPAPPAVALAVGPARVVFQLQY